MSGNIPNIEELKKRLNPKTSYIGTDILEDIDRLTEIDFSILRKEAIDDEKRELYSFIKVYQDVVIRNVYQSAMGIIKKEEDRYNLKIDNNDNGYNGIKVLGITPKKSFFNIFYYYYPDDYKQSMFLYEYKESYIRRSKEMGRILVELEYLYKMINENPGLREIRSYIEKIELLENRYIELANRTEMTDEDKYISEVQNHFTRLFENEFGINRKKDYIDINNKSWDRTQIDGMHRVLEKEYPTLILKKDVRYY